MGGRVVSDVQTWGEGESFYVWYNTDVSIVKYLWYAWVWPFILIENPGDMIDFK